ARGAIMSGLSPLAGGAAGSAYASFGATAASARTMLPARTRATLNIPTTRRRARSIMSHRSGCPGPQCPSANSVARSTDARLDPPSDDGEKLTNPPHFLLFLERGFVLPTPSSNHPARPFRGYGQ